MNSTTSTKPYAALRDSQMESGILLAETRSDHNAPQTKDPHTRLQTMDCFSLLPLSVIQPVVHMHHSAPPSPASTSLNPLKLQYFQQPLPIAY